MEYSGRYAIVRVGPAVEEPGGSRGGEEHPQVALYMQTLAMAAS